MMKWSLPWCDESRWDGRYWLTDWLCYQVMQRNLFSQPTVCSAPAKLFLVSWDKLGSGQHCLSLSSQYNTETDKLINIFSAKLPGQSWPVIWVFYQSTKLSGQRAFSSTVSDLHHNFSAIYYEILHHPGRFSKNVECSRDTLAWHTIIKLRFHKKKRSRYNRGSPFSVTFFEEELCNFL